MMPVSTVPTPYRIAIVGVGKIARDQHLPAIRNNPDFELAATVSRNGTIEDVEAFTDLQTMLAQRPDITVVALCMPPQVRYGYAMTAIAGIMSRYLRPGIPGLRQPWKQRGRSWPKPGSGNSISIGRRMSGDGIPARTGSGRPVAWVCLIRA